jgi:uncharacterized protein YabN with tetrapyrrole methylase and pyrophosphatase domain
LIVVGTGYGGSGRITPETRASIEGADAVFYLVSDPITASWIRDTNANARSLHDCYSEGRGGKEACDEMVTRILQPLNDGARVCAAFYGHPSIFVAPAREVVKQARALGYPARLLPAISALDCLYADLGVDPGVRGMQIYESTDFVVNRRTPDLATPLVILQAGAAGVTLYTEETVAEPGRVAALAGALVQFYEPAHQVVIYEAAPLPIVETRADWISLSALGSAILSVYSTLYVPAAKKAPSDSTMLTRLGLVDREGRITRAGN